MSNFVFDHQNVCAWPCLVFFKVIKHIKAQRITWSISKNRVDERQMMREAQHNTGGSSNRAGERGAGSNSLVLALYNEP